MKQIKKRGALIIVSTILAILIIASIGLLMQQSVSAGAPPPDVPTFEGEPYTAVLDKPDLLKKSPLAVEILTSGWTAVLSETFEAGIDSNIWTTFDNDGVVNGEYKWGPELVTNPLNLASQQSAWAVGDGAQGSALDPSVDGYPDNADSWLIYGPLDMSNATEAMLSFSYSLEADAGDMFSVSASYDGVNWNGLQMNSGAPGGWFSASYGLNDYVGEPGVYVGFHFTSDSNANGSNLLGALVDDVQLYLRIPTNTYLPILTISEPPTPTPTPTPIPGEDYIDSFTNNIDGWGIRKQSNNSNVQMLHRGDNDDTDPDDRRQGMLQMQIFDTDEFFLASPLEPGPEIPYNIEVSAIMKERKNKHTFGIVFAADWNGEGCPAGSPEISNCFNSYYWLRVIFRESASEKYNEFKLQRVNGYDDDNQPLVEEVLIPWTKVSGNFTGKWNEWDVLVEDDGDIKIFLNDERVGTVRDTSILTNPNNQFGLTAQTRENGNARFKFDYFKIEHQ